MNQQKNKEKKPTGRTAQKDVQCIGVRYLRDAVSGGIKPVSHRMHITCRFAWVLYKLSQKRKV